MKVEDENIFLNYLEVHSKHVPHREVQKTYFSNARCDFVNNSFQKQDTGVMEILQEFCLLYAFRKLVAITSYFGKLENEFIRIISARKRLTNVYCIVLSVLHDSRSYFSFAHIIYCHTSTYHSVTVSMHSPLNNGIEHIVEIRVNRIKMLNSKQLLSLTMLTCLLYYDCF